MIFTIAGCNAENNDIDIIANQLQIIDVIDSSDLEEVETVVVEERPVVYNQYTVNLDVDVINRKVSGVQNVNFTNSTDSTLDEIYFNIHLNAFREDAPYTPYFQTFENKIFKNGIDYSQFEVINVFRDNISTSFLLEDTHLKVKLEEPLEKDKSTEITLQFEAYIPKINHRTGANDNALWFGNFLPTLAVYNDGWKLTPYFQAGDPYYSEIANYIVNISVPEGFTVVGTGTKTTNTSENTTTSSFNASLVRDFAFAISNNYKKTTYTSDLGININMYYYSELDSVFTALNTAMKSLEYFNERLGKYPYSELDIVEVGLFFNSGMEYPQMIFMDSDYLKENAYFNTLVHEVGHQWIYNIIGNDQIHDAWLDEGFTKFLEEGLYYDSESLHTKMLNDYNITAENLKRYEKNGLNHSLEHYSSWTQYYNVQYSRAKLMFYSLNLKMGSENFDDFLKEYYKKYSYKIVTREQFINEVETFYGESLTEFFDAWFSDGEMPPLHDRHL